MNMNMRDYIFGRDSGPKPRPTKRFRLYSGARLLASASTRRELRETARVMGIAEPVIEDRNGRAD